MLNTEKHINTFHKNYAECKDCNSKRVLKGTMIMQKKYQSNERYIMKKLKIK